MAWGSRVIDLDAANNWWTQTDRAGGGHEDMHGGGAPSPLLWPGTRGLLRAHTPVGPGGPSPRGISSQL